MNTVPNDIAKLKGQWTNEHYHVYNNFSASVNEASATDQDNDLLK